MAEGGPDRLRFPPRLREQVAGEDTRFIVTGGGGWLGQATLEMLDDALGDRVPEQVHVYASRGRELGLRSGRRIGLRPLAELSTLPRRDAPTYLAHYAFLTREKTADLSAEAYIRLNRDITALATEEAARLHVAGTFSTSSGAVYRPDRTLETSLSANPYGALKREEEAAFAGFANGGGGRAAICRVFNLGGAFINKEYALSSFLAAALAGRPIEIRASRPVIRSYAHVRDVVAVGFAGMLGLGETSPEPYDTAGTEAVEVGELAARIIRVLGLPADRIVRPPPSGDETPDRYVGDGAAFARRAGSAGIAVASLDEQIRDTAAFMGPRSAGATAR